MTITATYPLESLALPNHLLVSFVAIGIFFLILVLYRQYIKGIWIGEKKRSQKTSIQKSGADVEMRENWNKNEILTIIGLLATVVATLIFPFVQNPLVDYDVTLENKNNVTLENKNKETIVPFQIDIRNWGLKTANNVIISLNMPGASFREIKSIPYLSEYLNTTSDNAGNQLVKIGAIPSSSQTTIMGNVVFPSSTGENLMVYLRSDETVGHRHVFLTLIFYLILGTSFVLIFSYLLFGGKLLGYKYDREKDPNDPNNYDYLMMKGKKVVEWIPIQNRHKKGLIKYVGIIAWYVTIFWLIYYLWLDGHLEIRDDKFTICILLLALTVIVLAVLLYYSFIKPHKSRWTLNKIM